MKNILKIAAAVSIIICNSCTGSNEKPEWKIADNPILTEWALEIDPLEPWAGYPRPDAAREEWINLNGLWDFSITGSDQIPKEWEGKILVPYPIESALSGVKKRVGESEFLWYRRNFRINRAWRKQQILLNFEASDWETTVWIDGKMAGTHRGGYDPFTYNITELIGRKKKHELLVCVRDSTDKGSQPRGKQVSAPEGIWYTPTTGIWQTVWIEPVEESYISSFRTYPDIENGSFTFTTDVVNPEKNKITVSILKDNNIVTSMSGNCNDAITLMIPGPKLWTPDNPVLYDVLIELKNGNKTIDKIAGYAGLRKISVERTFGGFTRLLLNNRFLYQNGPLDQGFWPDGIYTPPSEKAMIYDLEMIKEMGFNMLRKHVKIEPRIFYHWCDKLGILVWQDMPSGDKYINVDQADIEKTEESVRQFEYELKRMIETKFNHPSIIIWVPFNEGWGQFQTGRITQLIKDYDTTRLVISASGWTDRGTGDVKDIHHYPEPVIPAAENNRATVLGEFGGLGLPVQGHTWDPKNWGYRNMEDSLQLLERYESYYDQVHRFVRDNGLSATVYTQTTDVETETNGLMTYDRKINKMGTGNVYNANHNIIPPSIQSPVRIFTDKYSVKLSNYRPGGKIYFTTDGSEPVAGSSIYTEPLIINETTEIKAFTQWEDKSSRTASILIEKKNPIPSMEVDDLRPGLIASVYYGEFDELPDFPLLRSAFTRSTSEVTHTLAKRDSFFAIDFEGYLLIPANDVYGLSLISDDGSRLILDGTEIIRNDGIDGLKEEGGYFPLGKGYHKFRVEYFQREGGLGLKLLIEVPGHQKSVVPDPWFFH